MARETNICFKRIKKISTNIKIHLVESYVLPIIQYPTFPLITISKINHLNLQRIQNKALRFALTDKHPYTYIKEDLHIMTITETNNPKILRTKSRQITEQSDQYRGSRPHLHNRK